MNLGQLLATIFGGLKNELIIQVAPAAITFLGNTSKLDPFSVPGQLAYVAQLDLLRSSIAGAITSAAPTELTTINTAISNEIQAVLQAALTKAQAAQGAVAAAPKTA